MKNILLYFWTLRVSNRQHAMQRNKRPNCKFVLRNAQTKSLQNVTKISYTDTSWKQTAT